MIGYQASHEQFSPSELLQLVVLAEKHDFQFINSSDHIQPWSESQGHSGFSFAWLGAAMQSTSLPFSMVCAPGQRYHPAIVAQAIATLAEMFPRRFSIYLGSGEALNEKITGMPWPNKEVRNKRLLECYQIISALLKGETVTHVGEVSLQQARLFSLPQILPKIYSAAVTKETAIWMARWSPGVVTINRPMDELEELVKSFRNNGGQHKPLDLKLQISYARDYKAAESGAYDQWRTNVLPDHVLGKLSLVEEFDRAAEEITMEDVRKMVYISDDPDYFVKLIGTLKKLGFQNVIIHNVNREQVTFIEDFGQYVLPALHNDAAGH